VSRREKLRGDLFYLLVSCAVLNVDFKRFTNYFSVTGSNAQQICHRTHTDTHTDTDTHITHTHRHIHTELCSCDHYYHSSPENYCPRHKDFFFESQRLMDIAKSTCFIVNVCLGASMEYLSRVE